MSTGPAESSSPSGCQGSCLRRVDPCQDLSIQVVGVSSSAHVSLGARAPSLHSCWALSLHQKPHTAHVGLCGLQIALTAREPLTGNSAWGHTHCRQRCRLGDRLGDTGETTASCLCAGRPSGLLLCLQKYVKGNAG